MARSLVRFLLAVGAVGVAHAAFVGCGSSDETKWARPEGEGGEGGEAGAPGASASGSANGGSSGSGNGGSSGSANGGSAEPPGGESGAGGAPSGAGGESAAGGVAVVGAGGDGGSGGEASGCVPAQSSRITIGFDASNAEWVKNLQWLDSANVLSVNLAAFGGPETCGDPVEFFGQSYSAPEGTTPSVVYAGSRATAVSCGLDITISSTPNNCNAFAQIPWQTEYHFYGGAKASQMRVTRSFGFDENTPKFTGGLRPWQARVPLATLATVIYPNESGTAVTTTSASSCPGDCLVATGSSWNGEWFADIAAKELGLAVIVRRDPSMTSAVSLTINWDSYSTSNLTSFVLTQPDAGWQSPITEVEYVCFADLTSWPQAERDAATLPSWCGP